MISDGRVPLSGANSAVSFVGLRPTGAEAAWTTVGCWALVHVSPTTGLMPSSTGAAARDRIDGLGGLRIFAIALVTVQQVLSFDDQCRWTNYGRVTIGQRGVAIFLAISGLLAGSARRPPIAWLIQR